jgi:hypothetical protein
MPANDAGGSVIADYEQAVRYSSRILDARKSSHIEIKEEESNHNAFQRFLRQRFIPKRLLGRTIRPTLPLKTIPFHAKRDP